MFALNVTRWLFRLFFLLFLIGLAQSAGLLNVLGL